MRTIAFTGGRGNEGLSALLAAFGSLAGTSVLAECTFTYSRLLRLMKPGQVRTRSVPSIPRFRFDAERCSHCFKCLDICKHEAILRYGDMIHYAEHRCTACGSCIRWCPLCVLDFEVDETVTLSYAESRFGPLVYTDSIVDALHQPDMIAFLLEQAHHLAISRNIDRLHIRLPRGNSEAAARAASRADAIVIVTAPYPYALADLKKQHLFSRHCGILPIVLLNKVHPSNTRIVEEMRAYCTKEALPVAGEIPYDLRFPEAEQHACSLIEYDQSGEISGILEDAWRFVETHLNQIHPL